MNIRQCYLTENACYKAGQKMAPRGVMVHSTGANNPYLRRYVQPDDGILGENANGNHFNVPYPGGRSACVHAFIGLTADGDIATYQTLPWDFRGWHAGGEANNEYIGFEICEDNLRSGDYFLRAYNEAVELTAYLCELYGLDPAYPGVICHSEGHELGIASNHSDVMHWFPLFGKTMDDFRADVTARMEERMNPVYRTRDDIEAQADWGLETFDKLINKKLIVGEDVQNGKPIYNISRDMLRILTILDRAGKL